MCLLQPYLCLATDLLGEDLSLWGDLFWTYFVAAHLLGGHWAVLLDVSLHGIAVWVNFSRAQDNPSCFTS